MRKALAAAVLLAATLAVPAGAAEDRAIYVVANGPSIGTFTLPKPLALDFPNAVATTRSEYAVLIVSDAKGIVAIGGKIPDAAQHRYAGVVPAGRVTLRLMTSGPTTLRIPSRSVQRRTTFRLTKRLAGTHATIQAVTPLTPNAVHHAIPINVRVPSVIWHGFRAETTLGLMRTGMCVDENDATPCQVGLWQGGGSYWYLASAAREAGERFAKVTAAAAGPLSESVHWVLIVPMR